MPDLPGLFSSFTDDRHKVDPDIVVDDATLGTTWTGNEALRHDLISSGGGHFRIEPDLWSHGLNKIQMATSDSASRHGICHQFILLKTEEDQKAARARGETIERSSALVGGRRQEFLFVRRPLKTKEETETFLEELSSPKRLALAKRLGVAPEQLLSRLPYPGRPGMVIDSRAHAWSGTKLDGFTHQKINGLFEAFETLRLDGKGRAELQAVAKSLGLSLAQTEELVERKKVAWDIRAELLGQTDVEVEGHFPRPEPWTLPDAFAALCSYPVLKVAFENGVKLPELRHLREVLPPEVQKKFQGRLCDTPFDEVEALRPYWNDARDMIQAAEAWSIQQHKIWEDRCNDPWETLGMAASGVQEDVEEDGEDSYFWSDEHSVRPRQSILHLPKAEDPEEVKFGDLKVRINAQVTTPRDRLVFMGDAGPLRSEVPWSVKNEGDASGLSAQFNGHPMCRYLQGILDLAQQSRDPQAIELTENAFEVRRVNLDAYLYSRHPGYKAAEPIRREIAERQSQGRLFLKWLKSDPGGEAEGVLIRGLGQVQEDIKSLKLSLKEAEIQEAAWKADVAAGVKTETLRHKLRVSEARFDPIEEKAVKTGRFKTLDARLVNPEYIWDRKAEKPKLVSGEYWILQGSLTNEKGDQNKWGIIHVYPVPGSAQVGYDVKLWGVWNNEVVIISPDDPLLEVYGPGKSDAQMTKHFKSRLEAEAARFPYRKIPTISDQGISYQFAKDVFPDACRWVAAISIDWHGGVDGLVQVEGDVQRVVRVSNHETFEVSRVRKVRLNPLVQKGIKTGKCQKRFQRIPRTRREHKPDTFEVQVDQEDLNLALWEELRKFQDEALDKVIKANFNRHCKDLVANLKQAYIGSLVNPEWGWGKNQPDGQSFYHTWLATGTRFDRVLQKMREVPVLPKTETASELWRAMGFYGTDRPVTYMGMMVADRLCHQNPGVAGWRQTENGKRWVNPSSQFEAWRFNEGQLGRLKTACMAVMYPAPGTEMFLPDSQVVREEGVEEAIRHHLEDLVEQFLGVSSPKVARQLQGLLAVPVRQGQGLQRLNEIQELLRGEDQEVSQVERITRQLWVTQPKQRKAILESLLGPQGGELFGLRLPIILRDWGVLPGVEKVEAFDPKQISFCEPYVRSPAERL